MAKLCVTILATSLCISSGSGVQSIMGKELSSCSQPGTAMTGFTRDGRCADVGSADAGAHHVCIQMKSDFCTVTGQPNWCTTRDFPCMGQRGMCKIGNWCVCQWAFARYLERAGGCDSIIDLVCDATNMAAFTAYSRSKRPEHIAALECIKKKCGFGRGEASTTTTQAPEVVKDPLARVELTNGTCGGAGAENESGTYK